VLEFSEHALHIMHASLRDNLTVAPVSQNTSCTNINKISCRRDSACLHP